MHFAIHSHRQFQKDKVPFKIRKKKKSTVVAHKPSFAQCNLLASQVLATTVFLANTKLMCDEYLLFIPWHHTHTLTHIQTAPSSVLNMLRCPLLIQVAMLSRRWDLQVRSSGEKTELEVKIKGCKENNVVEFNALALPYLTIFAASLNMLSCSANIFFLITRLSWWIK